MSAEFPRAYLRVDPNIDQAYPDLRNTFVGLLCSGGRQPDRGRYRCRQIAEQLHSRAFIRRCLDRGDLVELADGRLYIDGWDEWQEGDLTVAERMRRMRSKRRDKRDSVTVPPSPQSNGVTTNAYAYGESESVEVDRPLGVGVGVGDSPKPPTSGGRRSEGTNPRAIAAEMTRLANEAESHRRSRRNARRLAFLDGRITQAQQAEMDDRDAPLSEIPAERGAAYRTELAS